MSPYYFFFWISGVVYLIFNVKQTQKIQSFDMELSGIG